MLISDFSKQGANMDNRAGRYKTNLSGEMSYKSFVPNPLPPSPPIELTEDIVGLLIDANSQIAVLEKAASHIPNMQLFISMYVRKEALLSSQIEGTQATLEDILDPSVDANANRDVIDVVNYVKAAHYAIERLKTLPLCNRLIKETHAILMEGVRGAEKDPGHFRRSQNWIGGQGSSLQNARYIPPSPEDMEIAMSDLEKYINADDAINALIKAALIHYQFETIHPFLDGNGRIGRLLITLFLLDKGVLTTPALYISYFLKKNRVEYYDRMSEVRLKGNYEQWISFFLQAIIVSAKETISSIDELSALHEKNVAVVSHLGGANKNAMAVFAYLEKHPIIEIGKTAAALGLSFNTVSNIVSRFVKANIVTPTSQNSRNRSFCYEAYLDILRKGT